MITKILNNKLILYSLFFGSVASWLLKEESTLLLLGKTFDARSNLVKLGILVSLCVLISLIVFFFLAKFKSIYRKTFSVVYRIFNNGWTYIGTLVFIIVFVEVLILNPGFVNSRVNGLEERHYSITDGSLYQFDFENGKLVAQKSDPNFTIEDINIPVRYISIKCENSIPDAVGQVFYRDENESFNESMSVRYKASLLDKTVSLSKNQQVFSLRFDLTDTPQDIITCNEFVINPRLPFELNQTRLAIYAGLLLLSILIRKVIVKNIYKFISEIASHIRLLHVDKKYISQYFSSPYRIIIIILFSILFLPHAFVVVNDLSFIAAYETDPGQIISSILSLFQNHYNMNNGAHSAYYGWTYYSINYFLLSPIYIIVSVLKIVPNDIYLFVSIRLVFFMIGMASVLAFYEVAKRILKQTFIAFIASILYIATPTTFRFFYFIHPETTGLLFLFISILCLIRYYEGLAEDYRWYTFGFFSLVLSVLSKQHFVLLAPSVIFLYYYFYCHYHKKPLFRFLITKQFAKLSLLSIVFSIVIFFFINPFAFIQAHRFIGNQTYLFSGHTQGAANMIQGLGAWFNIIKGNPIIHFSVLSFPFTILGVYIFRKEQLIGKLLYTVNILSALFFIGIISITSRLIIADHYFVPIFPFFILNFLSIPLYIIRKWNVSLVKLLTIFLLIYSLFSIIVADFSASLPRGYNRLIYQDGTTYKVYNYIEENIPDNSKITHDHFVGIPSNKGIIACHFWHVCGGDYIEEFQPDYVIFNENYSFNGVHTPTERLNQYINDHHFILITTIDSISVWKKPDK
jgi:hypothetical protein